jgi:hypothetical protein
MAVKAAGNGIAALVRQIQPRCPGEYPVFCLVLNHPRAFQTIYTGYGNSIITQKSTLNGGQKIATLEAAYLLFQIIHQGRLVNPRLYLPYRAGQISDLGCPEIPGVSLWLLAFRTLDELRHYRHREIVPQAHR